MKDTQHYQKPASSEPAASPKPTQAALAQGALEFLPSPEEVTRRTCFTYVNQGSRSGHEVQHWLKAESDLLAERYLTRIHGFHNPT